MSRQQCVAPTNTGKRCKNLVRTPKIVCQQHEPTYQTDELHDGECDCSLCELARTQPVGIVEFSSSEIMAAFRKDTE